MSQQYKPKNVNRTEIIGSSKSERVSCLIYQVEGAGPDTFYKKSQWDIAIQQGTFMGIGTMKKSLSAKMNKQPAQVRLFIFSGTGQEGKFNDKLQWVVNPNGGKIMRNELVPSNLIYAAQDEDKIEISNDGLLMAGNLHVKLLLVVSSEADNFGAIFEEPKRDLKGELLAVADSMSYNLEQLRLAAMSAKTTGQAKNGE